MPPTSPAVPHCVPTRARAFARVAAHRSGPLRGKNTSTGVGTAATRHAAGSHSPQSMTATAGRPLLQLTSTSHTNDSTNCATGQHTTPRHPRIRTPTPTPTANQALVTARKTIASDVPVTCRCQAGQTRRTPRRRRRRLSGNAHTTTSAGPQHRGAPWHQHARHNTTTNKRNDGPATQPEHHGIIRTP
jgi:hypothetical protein